MRREKEAVLVLDTLSKSSIPVLESLARMGLYVVAAAEKRYCCGFYSRAVRERIVYPPPATHLREFLDFLLDLLSRRRFSVVIPLGHHMTALVAEHQADIRKYARMCLPPSEVFAQGLSKIPTLKAAEHVGCPIPKTWYPDEQPLEDIAATVPYPVLIKPAVTVGARGMSLCHTAEALVERYPRIVSRYGACSVQEYLPQTGTQYKCAIVVDEQQELLSGIVYAKLRYYPVEGGSSTLNYTVDRPDILAHCHRVARHLKWFGTCDFDWITDPRDGSPKLMEINPRFSDTYKMTAVAGQDMTRIVYQLAKGEKPEPQLHYDKGKYLRFLSGDILWFLAAGPRRWSARPWFFDFFRADTTWLMTGKNDVGPVIGYILGNISVLWDRKARQFRLRRDDA